MTSYLSVDLDYWGMQQTDVHSSITKFLDKCISIKVPIKVYDTHEHILNQLNRYKVDHLYQIDFHSDVCESDVDELSEGTWANFYKYREECVFEWRYPSFKRCFQEKWGRCDASQHDDYEGPWPKNLFPYKKIIRKQGLSSIDWSSIVAIGISVSREWYDDEIEYVFEEYSFLKGF